MCVLKCFKYKIKSNIIIKILILMAYFIHKYMFGDKKENPLIVDLRMTSSGVAHISFLCFVFQYRRGDATSTPSDVLCS